MKKEISKCGNKIEQSNVVAKKISKLIKSKKIDEIVFFIRNFKGKHNQNMLKKIGETVGNFAKDTIGEGVLNRTICRLYNFGLLG